MKVKEIIELLVKKLDECIREDISMDRLPDNILVLKTAKDDIFIHAIEKLRQLHPTAKISVLCEEGDKELLESLPVQFQKIYYHDGKLDAGKAEGYIPLPELEKIDAVCFLNYQFHSESYLNVERVCARLTHKTGRKVYAYTQSKENICRYTDLEAHIILLKLYCGALDIVYKEVIGG